MRLQPHVEVMTEIPLQHPVWEVMQAIYWVYLGYNWGGGVNCSQKDIRR